jgi:hypothetical protein
MALDGWLASAVGATAAPRLLSTVAATPLPGSHRHLQSLLEDPEGGVEAEAKLSIDGRPSSSAAATAEPRPLDDEWMKSSSSLGSSLDGLDARDILDTLDAEARPACAPARRAGGAGSPPPRRSPRDPAAADVIRREGDDVIRREGDDVIRREGDDVIRREGAAGARARPAEARPVLAGQPGSPLGDTLFSAASEVTAGWRRRSHSSPVLFLFCMGNRG